MVPAGMNLSVKLDPKVTEPGAAVGAGGGLKNLLAMLSGETAPGPELTNLLQTLQDQGVPAADIKALQDMLAEGADFGLLLSQLQSLMAEVEAMDPSLAGLQQAVLEAGESENPLAQLQTHDVVEAVPELVVAVPPGFIESPPVRQAPLPTETLLGGKTLPHAATADPLDTVMRLDPEPARGRLVREVMDLGPVVQRLAQESLPPADKLPALPSVTATRLQVPSIQIPSIQIPTAPALETLVGMVDRTGTEGLGSLVADRLLAGAGASPAGLTRTFASNLLAMGIPQPVQTEQWSGALADRVMWMVRGDQQQAELKLYPANLGPLEVKVSISQEQTSVSFLANSAAVRDALEAALPRLREMFEQQSLNLGQVDIGQRGGGDERASDGRGGAGSIAGEGEEGDHETIAEDATAPSLKGTSLVDLFA